MTNKLVPESSTPPSSSQQAQVSQPEGPSRGRLIATNIVAGGGLVLSIVASFFVNGPSLWGLLPIVLYAALALMGMDIVVATVVSIVIGFVLAHAGPVEITKVLGDSMADQITMIGLIIMLGTGVGEVLKVTGAADKIVTGVMRVFGGRSKTALVFGVMISCLTLVACLGTLAGAIAIAAPLLIPITARLGYTRSATASMMFIGGCAGLALAPFAGSNVAIMNAAEVSYGQYVLYGAGPIAIVSLVVGVPVVAFIQRISSRTGDFYTTEETGQLTTERPAKAGRAAAVFLIVVAIAVVFATVTAAGTAFPLLALPVLGFLTGLAGRLPVTETLKAMYKGCASMVSIFILFWLLAVLFQIIDLLAPFQVILDTYGEQLKNTNPFVFTILIALLGWVGVPGATAAQVVLLDKVFGGVAGTLGITAGSWTVVLLFASKADTYGPFPNGNMVGVMGLAHSKNLKNMLITGWLLLVPACIVYAGILFFETR